MAKKLDVLIYYCGKIGKKVCTIVDGILAHHYLQKYQDIYYLCSRGMGDTVYFLSLLGEYYRINPGTAKINIIIQKNHVVIANAYKRYLNKIVIADKKKMRQMACAASINLLPNNIKYIIPGKDPLTYLGYKSFSIWDLQCITLGLPEIKNFVKPNFSSFLLLGQFYKKIGLSGKNRVILAPSAVTVSNVYQKNIWRQIAEIYISNGYQVFTNIDSDSMKPISGTLPLKTGVDMVYNMCEDGAEFVGLRSGLCDLVAFSKCKMIVLYPCGRNENDYVRNYSFSYMPFDKEIIELTENDVIDYLKNHFNRTNYSQREKIT